MHLFATLLAIGLKFQKMETAEKVNVKSTNVFPGGRITDKARPLWLSSGSLSRHPSRGSLPSNFRVVRKERVLGFVGKAIRNTEQRPARRASQKKRVQWDIAGKEEPQNTMQPYTKGSHKK